MRTGAITSAPLLKQAATEGPHKVGRPTKKAQAEARGSRTGKAGTLCIRDLLRDQIPLRSQNGTVYSFNPNHCSQRWVQSTPGHVQDQNALNPGYISRTRLGKHNE